MSNKMYVLDIFSGHVENLERILLNKHIKTGKLTKDHQNCNTLFEELTTQNHKDIVNEEFQHCLDVNFRVRVCVWNQNGI